MFLEIQKAQIVPIEVQYLHRGSLKYEFSTELLQAPIQLIKINNVQTQVLSQNSSKIGEVMNDNM